MTFVGAPIALAAMALVAYHLRRLIKFGTSDRWRLIPLVLLVYSLLFSADCAIGRVCLGLPAGPEASRYVTLMIPAFLALYFGMISLPRGTMRTVAVCIFAMSLVPTSIFLSGEVFWYARVKTTWSECYLRNANIQYCDQVAGFSIYPMWGPERALLQWKLDYLKEHQLNFFADPADKHH